MKNTGKLFGIIAAVAVIGFSMTGCATTGQATAPQSLDLLLARTTVHAGFVPTPLSQADIDLLVRAGFTAPTGGDQRSFDLFVVTDREVMRRMRINHPYSAGLETAPLVIVVAADESRARFPELHEMDASLAGMSMVVQATGMGLASCILSITPQEERIASVRAALSMPDHFMPVMMVAFGHPGVDAISNASALVPHRASQLHVNAYGRR